MKTSFRIAASFLTVAAVALPWSAAQAIEGAENGVSLTLSTALAADQSVAERDTGKPLHEQLGSIGVNVLANLGQVAVGGIVDSSPALFGDGRFAVGALGGWQPMLGPVRLQVLGEAGGHLFTDVGGQLFTTGNREDIWLPYWGARVGASRAFFRYLDLGASVFFRQDVGRASATAKETELFGGVTTVHNYDVGGFMGGFALNIGVRLEKKRPAHTDP